MIISIDHGNKSIKTPTLLFTSGLVESATKPGFQGDYIFWERKYYSLTEKRISYLRGKTEGNRFYALTLFAIAYEFRQAGIESDPITPVDITLLIGFPSAHYGRLHERFEQYFFHKRDIMKRSSAP